MIECIGNYGISPRVLEHRSCLGRITNPEMASRICDNVYRPTFISKGSRKGFSSLSQIVVHSPRDLDQSNVPHLSKRNPLLDFNYTNLALSDSS